MSLQVVSSDLTFGWLEAIVFFSIRLLLPHSHNPSNFIVLSCKDLVAILNINAWSSKGTLLSIKEIATLSLRALFLHAVRKFKMKIHRLYLQKALKNAELLVRVVVLECVNETHCTVCRISCEKGLFDPLFLLFIQMIFPGSLGAGRKEEGSTARMDLFMPERLFKGDKSWMWGVIFGKQKVSHIPYVCYIVKYIDGGL